MMQTEPFTLDETTAARDALSATRAREADLKQRLAEAKIAQVEAFKSYDAADASPAAIRPIEQATARVQAIEAQLADVAVKRAEHERQAAHAEREQATIDGMVAAQGFGAAGFVAAHKNELEDIARTVGAARRKLDALLADADRFNVDAVKAHAAVERANAANVEDLKIRMPPPPPPVESEKERQRLSVERFGRKGALSVDAYRDELQKNHDYARSQWLGRVLLGAQEFELTAVPATRTTIKEALEKSFSAIEGIIK